MELARLLLYAHDNPDADTDARLAKLQQLFDTVMGHEGPGDGEVVWTYVTAVFEPSSRIYRAMLEAIEKRKKQEEQPMYASIDNPWFVKGRAEGRAEGIAEGRAEGIVKGRAEGIARALLDVVEQRQLPLPEAERTRILTSQDAQVLSCWFRRALVANSIDEILSSDVCRSTRI